MAMYESCDGGCGAVSPDAEGLYQANQWINVRITPRKTNSFRDLTYCVECYNAIKWPEGQK